MYHIIEDFVHNQYLNEASVDPDKFVKSIKNDLKSLLRKDPKKILNNEVKRFGLDLNSIERDFKRIAKRPVNKFYKSVTSGNERSAQGTVLDFLEEISDYIDEMAEIDSENFGEAFKIFAKVLLIMLSLQIFINAFLVIILPSSIVGTYSTIISAVILAPLIEELGKKEAMQNGASSEFLLIFNVIEGSMYIATSSVSLPVIVTARVFAALSHYIDNFIHFHFQRKGDPDMGYYMAVISHAVWNSSAVIANAL